MGKVVELFDCLKLRCSNCEKEKYEIDIDIKDDLYTCECGSHTFIPLNLEETYGIY